MAKTMTKAGPVVEVLNKLVADWSVMYMKLHNYHWFVKGENFFTLHLKLEKLYEQAALHMDEIAERILGLGGSPVGTLKECLSMATIKEANGSESTNEMVRQVVKDFETFVDEMKEGIAAAEEQGDQPTVDMLTTIEAEVEKHIWMLKSYLGK